MFDQHERTMQWLRGDLHGSAELGLFSRLLREEQPMGWGSMVKRAIHFVDKGILAPDGTILRRPAHVTVRCTECGEWIEGFSGGALECECGHEINVETIYTT